MVCRPEGRSGSYGCGGCGGAGLVSSGVEIVSVIVVNLGGSSDDDDLI